MGYVLSITADMPPIEAQALLVAMRAQYSVNLNEHWYADEFRCVPSNKRHSSILRSKPAMAAQKRLMAALSLSLKAVPQT